MHISMWVGSLVSRPSAGSQVTASGDWCQLIICVEFDLSEFSPYQVHSLMTDYIEAVFEGIFFLLYCHLGANRTLLLLSCHYSHVITSGTGDSSAVFILYVLSAALRNFRIVTDCISSRTAFHTNIASFALWLTAGMTGII
jgi:hypothetical protein